MRLWQIALLAVLIAGVRLGAYALMDPMEWWPWGWASFAAFECGWVAFFGALVLRKRVTITHREGADTWTVNR